MATKGTTAKTNPNDQSELVNTLEAQIEGLQSDVHALMKAVSDRGEKRLDKAADAVSETSHKTAELAQEELDQIRDYIKKQPIKSVGLALGAGVALALLSRG